MGSFTSEVAEKFPVLLADYFSQSGCDLGTIEKAFKIKYQTESAD